MEKVLQEFFWEHIFGCPYCLNSTKIHLDETLLVQGGLEIPCVLVAKANNYSVRNYCFKNWLY